MYAPLDTILLAVGPNDDTRLDELAEAVIQIAEPTGSAVVLTHVFTPEEFENAASNLGYQNITVEEVDEILERHSTVRHFEEAFEEYEIEYDVRGVVGDISDGIVGIAEDTDSDRVIVSGRTRSSVGKAVFGSTAQNVLMNAPCPVTFVKAQAVAE